MNEYRDVIILFFLLLYLAMCLGVGAWALRRTTSSRDFFMAGRDLGIVVTSAAIFSSTLSGFAFVGGPGLIYRMGTSSLWMMICGPFSTALSFYLIGKRLRMLAEVHDAVSLPDVVAARYRSETARLLTAVAILLGAIGYLAVQILAMGRVLETLLEPWLGTWGIWATSSLAFCVTISCAVLVFYCVTGGIVASVYTDLVQGIVMVIAGVLVFFAARNAVPGGFAEMSRTLLADDAGAIGPWGTLGMLGCLSWYFLFGLGAAGQPHLLTKMMMNRNVGDIRRIAPLVYIGTLLGSLLWLGVGLAMRSLVVSGEHAELANADAAAAEFLRLYAHPVLAGIVFAALFAAIMSTADGFLNVAAAAVVHDIPRALRGRAIKDELFWARTATFLIAVTSAVFALYTGDLVAILGAFGWGMFAAALVPVVAVGLAWKRATATAASVSIAASLVINLAIQLLGIRIPWGISGGAVALIVSLTLFFAVSWLTPEPELDPDVEMILDL